MNKTKINLTGVPETMLWPLYNRACEQKRPDRMLEDPMSLRLMGQIDYNFENFGKFNAGHPLRSYVFDETIKAWLNEYPEGTIISLGEGLDTQFWRLDNGLFSWISVDVPEAIEVRERFLPSNKRMKNISCSALNFKWLEDIEKGKPVFIVLAGVIMYFTEKEAKTLLAKIADRFDNCEIIFDMIPEWYSQKTIKGMNVTKTYKAPPMPFGLDYKNYEEIIDVHPKLQVKDVFTFVDFFPKRMRPFSYFRNIKWIRDKMAPWMIHLEVK